jgi:hypothetical protein
MKMVFILLTLTLFLFSPIDIKLNLAIKPSNIDGIFVLWYYELKG